MIVREMNYLPLVMRLNKLHCLIAGLGAAFSLPAWAAAPASPFAERPFSVEASGSRFVNDNPPKPNFLFVFDASNTMGGTMSGGGTRLGAAKASLKSIIGRYNNEFNWSMVTVPSVPSVDNAIKGGYTTGSRISGLLDGITVNYGTPMTSRYLDAAQTAINGIEYSCQRSYIVLMSDGETGQNTWPAIRNKLDNYRLNDSRRLSDYFGALPADYCTSWENGYPWRARHFCGSSAAVLRSNYSFGAANTRSISQNSARPWPSPLLTQTWSATTYSKVGSASNGYDLDNSGDGNDGHTINKGGAFFTNGSGYRLTDNNANALNYRDGVSYFSHILAVKDVKSSGTDKEGRSWNNDLFPKQVVQTYSIAFTDSSLSGNAHYYLATSSALTPPDYERDIRTSIATQVAASERMGVPGYYTAGSQAALTQAFDKIIEEIKKQEPRVNISSEGISTASPAVAMSAQESGLSNYAAYLTLNTTTWGSQLLYQNLLDSAQDVKVPDYSARTILVNNGRGVVDIGQTDAALFGLKNKEELVYGLIPWLKRPAERSDEAIEADVAARLPDAEQRTVPEYRVRTDSANDDARMMGDVIGAPVLNMLDGGGGHKRYMVTAANDGMLYAFKYNGNGEYPYKLALNYMPAAMQRESTDGSDTVAKALPDVAASGYGGSSLQPHLYLHNGGMEYRTTATTGGAAAQTFVEAALGQGGRGAYVVNIGGKDRRNGNDVGLDAGAASWASSVPVFETDKSAANKLGYTVSTPRIGLVATEWADAVGNVPVKSRGVRNYLFLANGYAANNSAVPHDGVPTLYVYDILGQEFGTAGAAEPVSSAPGKLVATIAVAVRDAYTMAAGFDRNYTALSTPTLVDTNADNIFDTAYAGDSGGNLYRFSLKGGTDSWQTVKIYSGATERNSKGRSVATQPITAAPAVYRKTDDTYVVLVGTGSDIFASDLKNTRRQVMLGIFDDPAAAASAPVSQSDLVAQSFTTTSTREGAYDYVSNRAVAANTKGWVLALDSATAERIVGMADVHAKTVYVTTRGYSPETVRSDTPPLKAEYTCGYLETTATSGSARALQLNVLTGSSPASDASRFKLPEASIVGGYYPASLRLKGASSSISLISRSGGLESSINVEGQGQSGVDGEINHRPNTGNQCVNRNDYTAVVADQDGVRVFDVESPLCSGNKQIKRISWRELI